MIENNPVREIMSLFGGLKKMAAALGHKNHSTIYGWVRSGKIPSWRDAELRAATMRCDVKIPRKTYLAAFGFADKSEPA